MPAALNPPDEEPTKDTGDDGYDIGEALDDHEQRLERLESVLGLKAAAAQRGTNGRH
jgi:hypothetical protein